VNRSQSLSGRSPIEEDLFRPTLTEEDDAVGFDRPWNPYHLVLVTFFSGLPGGGVLLALNFRRLGMKEKVHFALWEIGAASVLLFALAGWLAAGYRHTANWSSTSQLLRLGLQAISVVVALLIAGRQRRRFRLFEASNLPGGKLFWPIVAALIGGMAATALLVGFFLFLFTLGGVHLHG